MLPTGIRSQLSRERLKRRHGLVHVSGPAPQVVWDSKFGDYCRIGSGVTIRESTIGHYSYIERGSILQRSFVGNFTSIAHDVKIGMPEHPTSGFVSTHPFFYSPHHRFGYPPDRRYFSSRCDTHIGSDVWIGANVVVRSGVSIGHGAVVGSGAIVVKDVAPYNVVGGVPARVLGKRFDDTTVEFLLQSQWWERDLEWIRKNWRSFHSIDVLKSTLDR